ncbi:MAG: helix-turn-helix domain-containing protein [Actinomycetota bacterium]|nr:helix-turn-helix domain-containing protein [Actinomycetota bacterium]
MSLLTYEQVAERLNTTVRHIQNLRATGRLTCVKIGGLVRFDEQDLIEYIAAHKS